MITATAALESGNWSLDETYDDTGQFCFEGGAVPCERRRRRLRAVDLVEAIQVSDDVFFYNLGDRTELHGEPQRRSAAAVGAPVWDRRADGHRPAGRARPDRAVPRPGGSGSEEATVRRPLASNGRVPDHPDHKLTSRRLRHRRRDQGLVRSATT